MTAENGQSPARASETPYLLLSRYLDLLARKQIRAAGEPLAQELASYLAFSCGKHRFLVDMQYTVGVESELGHLSPLPFAPNWLLGLTSLRGDIYSVSDLRKFLGLQLKQQRTNRHHYVLLRKEDQGYILKVDNIFGLKHGELTAYRDDALNWVDAQVDIEGEKWLKINIEKLLIDPIFSQRTYKFGY